MQVQFEDKSHSCLLGVLEEVQNMEQTQEIRISEGMPGIDRVVSAWGQVVMRSKDWHGGGIHLSAGMMVWVLYIGEDGSNQCTEGWIPFQLHWELPEGCLDGNVRILCLPRYVDARSVSAGKIMVRAGVAVLAEAWCPGEKTTYHPLEVPEGVELLQATYPVRLPKEAGEKSFLLEEELTLPASAPVPRKLICFRMDPAVTDKKVLSNKIVFRGNGNLHVLYESADGQIHSWDFELPWSQFAELEDSHSGDAQADLRLMPTNMELELTETGDFQFRSSLTAQYLVDDQELIELTEDAYNPNRELNLKTELLELPAFLDSRREVLSGEQSLPGQADIITDVQFLPDFPTQHRMDGEIFLDMPGLVQVLYYNAEGALQSSVVRWEGKHRVSADDLSRLSAIPFQDAEIQATPGSDSLSVRTTVGLQLRFLAGQGIPMVTGMTLGEPLPKKSDRPSLIIRRVSDDGLWNLAKASHSSMEAIRKANDLKDEPVPGQLLLIPVN